MSQDNEKPFEKLEQMKIEFFNQRLQLDSDESERFWPLYRDYNNRQEKINEDRRSLYRYVNKNSEYLLDNEVKELLQKLLDLEKKQSELIELYNGKFLDILPPKKVMRVYITENQFKAHILNQIRTNRPGPGQGRGRNF